MKNRMKNFLTLLVPVAGAVFLSGCAAFRASTKEVDVSEKQHFDADFDYSDMRGITESIVAKLNSSPFLQDQPEPPVMMFAGVQNRSTQYVDTKSLTDRVRTLLFQGGTVRFVNETRRADLLKEQGYTAAHATPETQIAVGRQLGAKYMLSGSLSEMESRSPRQVRVSKQERKYYKLTFEVTDLESSELVWTTEEEFAREASKPLIGW